MLIEDDIVDQMAFKRAVDEQDLPYRYTLAGSIFQAREILDKESFDLVVCDLTLGDGTLFDILQTIVNKDIPVIVATGTGDEETAVKAIKQGANDYIIKYLNCNYLRILATTIYKALENKKGILERQKAEAALRLSEERFSKAFHCNPDPISISKLQGGHYVEVNDAFLKTFGYKLEEVIGCNTIDLGNWIIQEERDILINEIIKQGSVRNREMKFRKNSGELLTMLLSAEIIDVNDELHLLCISKDITEQKRAQEAFQESEERFRTIFNSVNDAIFIHDIETGAILDINQRTYEMYGYSREEVIGLGIADFSSGEPYTQQVAQDMLKRVAAEKSQLFEWRARNKAGTDFWVEMNARLATIGDEKQIMVSVRDITQRKQAEEEIKYLSFNDKLTGLYNRAFFEEELKRIDTDRQLPISLILGDVNGLKLINDALGHEEGDKLLAKVAEILKKACRQEDIVARWGGDEFIILLPDCDIVAATRVFEHIKKSCQNISDLSTQISISLGLASKNSTTQNIREVIKEAEDKMNRNKLLESKSARSSFIISLEKTLWTRSHETKDHCQRMQEIAHKIGKAVELPDSDLDDLKLLAALHDIGKIAVPNNILDKPGKLSADEWDIIKKHPEIGYRIALSSPELAPIAEAILSHHERWDGSGYPFGLKGESIPHISRIIAVTDTYDTMINGRPYRNAVSQAEALCEIKKCAGTHFDPDISEIFVELAECGFNIQS